MIWQFVSYMFTHGGSLFLGASGAIFAVQLAHAALFPDPVVFLWGILLLRAPIMVLGFTAIELFSHIFGRGSGVARLIHLAGFAFGRLSFPARFGANPWMMRMRR
jgi:membrane associated rhomboid family serine protease